MNEDPVHIGPDHVLIPLYHYRELFEISMHVKMGFLVKAPGLDAGDVQVQSDGASLIDRPLPPEKIGIVNPEGYRRVGEEGGDADGDN